MNFYNPYLYNIPAAISTPKVGILSRIFKSGGLKLGSILSGTQKTLNFVNQVIPVVKQVSPMLKNAKTMFRVMNEFKKTDNNTNYDSNSNMTQQSYYETNKETENKKIISNKNNNLGPTFFI